MATEAARLSLEEMLTGEDFVDPLPMSEFAGEFGERELADLLVARQQLRGRPRIPIRSTGMYGRDIARAARGEGARAAGAGLISGAARSRRISDYAKAGLLRQRQEQAAESATNQMQRKLRAKVLETVGGFAEEGLGLLGEAMPGIVDFETRRKAQKAENEALAKKTIENLAQGVDVRGTMLEEALGGISTGLRDPERGLMAPGMTSAGRFGRGIVAGGTQVAAPPHEVVRGDTLGEIAKRYGTTVQALSAMNPAIKDPNLIRVGEEIVVAPGAVGAPRRALYGRPRLDVGGESFWSPSAGRYESLLGPVGPTFGIENIGALGSELDEIQAGLDPVGIF